MSMFILNSILSERYPTVINGLMYTYPFDGEMHCCIANTKYAKVLVINNGSNELYNYFQSKGSLLTTLTLDTDLDNLQVDEGQYNIIAIDSANKKVSDDVLKKIKEISSNARVSVIVHSLNDSDTIYNYGGSYTYIHSKVKEKIISDAITKSALYKSRYNNILLDDCLMLENGYITIPWDNRLDDFTICFNLEVDNYKNKIDLISIKNNSDLLFNAYFDSNQNKLIINANNVDDIKYNILDNISILDSINKIIITKQDYTFKVFLNDKLYLSANITSSIKGNALIVGESSLSEINDLSVIRISNLSLYDKALSYKEIDVLNNGRLIFT